MSFEIGHTWLGFLVWHELRGCVWGGMPTPPWLLALWASHRARKTYIGHLEAAVISSPYFSLPPE